MHASDNGSGGEEDEDPQAADSIDKVTSEVNPFLVLDAQAHPLHNPSSKITIYFQQEATFFPIQEARLQNRLDSPEIKKF